MELEIQIPWLVFVVRLNCGPSLLCHFGWTPRRSACGRFQPTGQFSFHFQGQAIDAGVCSCMSASATWADPVASHPMGSGCLLYERVKQS